MANQARTENNAINFIKPGKSRTENNAVNFVKPGKSRTENNAKNLFQLFVFLFLKVSNGGGVKMNFFLS